jgi:two-component system, NarL family, invasion response regulator UvrY
MNILIADDHAIVRHGLKQILLGQLIAAIQEVMSGGKYISQMVAELLAARLASDEETLPHETLSDREYEVLCLIASGKTIGQIARQLSTQPNTISTYRARILDKMGMKTNADLTRYVIENTLSL